MKHQKPSEELFLSKRKTSEKEIMASDLLIGIRVEMTPSKWNKILEKLDSEFISREDVIEMIREDLKNYRYRLKDKTLPYLTQANLSGMILALEELKSKIKESGK